MQKVGNDILFSATDVVNFLECEHPPLCGSKLFFLYVRAMYVESDLACPSGLTQSPSSNRLRSDGVWF
jgi:hypothetical protein